MVGRGGRGGGGAAHRKDLRLNSRWDSQLIGSIRDLMIPRKAGLSDLAIRTPGPTQGQARHTCHTNRCRKDQFINTASLSSPANSFWWNVDITI